MIDYNKFKLENGLTVIHHLDDTTPVAAFNMVYNVGARDEDEELTGFAHLFEHLMFEGSANVSNFDEHLQRAGGQSNAFTSNDITNYYCTIPVQNLETAMWLDADRLMELDFSEHSLDVQRNVVVEEFKQRYLNQPYGDVWLLLRPLAYKEHPYKWATIGKKIEHIEEASISDVKDFFYKYYGPDNAIMCVAGNISLQEVKELTQKYFAPIPSRNVEKKSLPLESEQTELRRMTVERNVPSSAIYFAFHMVEKNHPDYHAYDLLSDILSRGQSSRLQKNLTRDNPKFNEINAYVTGSDDAGLFLISGKPKKDVTLEEAEQLIWHELNLLVANEVEERELQKVKNKVTSSLLFSEMTALNKAMSLCFYELQGDAALINHQVEKYEAVTREDLLRISKQVFREENCSILHYKSAKK